MTKRFLISISVILSIIFTVYTMISVGFIYMDYLGQGRLNFVTIYDRACITSFCTGITGEMTISSPDKLRLLESAFFNKIQDTSHLTMEDGTLKFVFHYDKKDIELHTDGITKTATIYYINRHTVYHFNENETHIFDELFSIIIPKK